MVNSKIYLDVPFAQKDDAKSLGARWDPSKKKWYAPNTVDISLFAKWSNDSSTSPLSTKHKKTARPTLGTVTYAKDKSFTAYSDESPPWD